MSADAHPDHDTLSEFRKRHLEALAGLFTQALQLCEKAGLLKLGHVSIDGTKIKADAGVPTDRSRPVGWKASKHKAISYARMGETERRLKVEIEALLKQADLQIIMCSQRIITVCQASVLSMSAAPACRGEADAKPPPPPQRCTFFRECFVQVQHNQQHDRRSPCTE